MSAVLHRSSFCSPLCCALSSPPPLAALSSTLLTHSRFSPPSQFICMTGVSNDQHHPGGRFGALLRWLDDRRAVCAAGSPRSSSVADGGERVDRAGVEDASPPKHINSL